MKSVQIRNVPEETHAVLRTRASAAGMSLQPSAMKLRKVAEAWVHLSRSSGVRCVIELLE